MVCSPHWGFTPSVVDFEEIVEPIPKDDARDSIELFNMEIIDFNKEMTRVAGGGDVCEHCSYSKCFQI